MQTKLSANLSKERFAQSSRIVDLVRSAGSRANSPCLVDFTSKKRYSIVFSRSLTPEVFRRLESPISPSPPKEKSTVTQMGNCAFWRRRRDLDSRAGKTRPTPLAGAPLRPLEYFSKKSCRPSFLNLPLYYNNFLLICQYFFF